jgi:NAD-dependent DNA ligase
VVLVEDLKESSTEEWIQELPTRCECGAQMALTDTMVHAFCTDRLCYLKIAARMEEMAKQLRVDGFGLSTCRVLAKTFRMRSPFELFNPKLIGIDVPGVAALPKKIEELRSKLNDSYELSDIVMLARLPGIDSLAKKIFKGFDSMEDAYHGIHKKGYVEVAQRIGNAVNGENVQARAIYEELIGHKTELILGEKIFRVVKARSSSIDIAITGEVRGYRNKQLYVDEINAITEKYDISVVMAKSMSKGVKYLICEKANGSSSGKSEKARQFGIPIITSERFKEMAIAGLI